MVKIILITLMSIFVSYSFSQETYHIYSYKLLTLQKDAGLINGQGMYNNGTDQRGGGVIKINQTSFSINLHSNFGDPDLLKSFSSVKNEIDKTIYYCSDSTKLIVFSPKLLSDKKIFQIHLNTDYDKALKLPSKKYVFEAYQLLSDDEVTEQKANTSTNKLSEIESRVFKANEVNVPPVFEVINKNFYNLFESPAELSSIMFTIDANGNMEDCRAVYSVNRQDYVSLDSIEKYIRFTSPSKIIVDNIEYSVKSTCSLCFDYNISDKLVLRAKFKKKKGTIQVSTIYKNYEGGQEFLDGDYQSILLNQLSEKEDGSYILNINSHTTYGSLKLQTQKGTRYITVNCDNETKVPFWKREYFSEHTNLTYY